MMRFQTKLKPSYHLIDLTPLVDVIFLLLIFFFITSDILPLKSLNLENPKLETESTPLTTQIIVVMDAQNVIYVGSKKIICEYDTLKKTVIKEVEKFHKRFPENDPTIVLSVDRRVEYGPFLKLFSICQECGNKLRLVYMPA